MFPGSEKPQRGAGIQIRARDPACSRHHMYIAVVGEDGHVRVREAEPRVWDLYRPPARDDHRAV